jgi:hypothetical protein
MLSLFYETYTPFKFIFFDRSANYNDDRHSSKLLSLGFIEAIRHTLAYVVKQFYIIRVNFESLYGVFLDVDYDIALKHFPSEVNELLINIAS